MKQQLSLLILLALQCAMFNGQWSMARAQDLSVCTYNLRYKNSGDTDAGNGWNTRRTYLINLMNFQKPDLLGVQEATNAQMTDMANGMKGYAYIGVGRTDGDTSGEYSAIFYNKERLLLLDYGYYWLSDTPDKPSKGFPSKGGGTSYYRIMTWGKFYDKAHSVVLYHFNTHLDLDETNRQQSFYLTRQKIEEVIGSKTVPIIITGDYNAVQTGDAYKLFLNSGFLYDCHNTAKQKFITNGTSPGFNAENYSTASNELRRIDHIFVTRAFTVKRYAALNPCYYSTSGTATYHQRAYSDHSPVIAKLSYRTTVPTIEVPSTLPPIENGIYQISTAQELQAFSYAASGMAGFLKNASAQAVLTNDIDLSEASDWLPIGLGILPDGKRNIPFTGTFDGQGHTIRGLSKSRGAFSGLFGLTSGATIKNLSAEGDMTFRGGTDMGLVGWADATNISGVHSRQNITISGTSCHVGGICGSMRSGTKLASCSFDGTLTEKAGSHDCLGGIAGYANENCLVEDCANYAPVTFANANAYAGGILGYVNSATFKGVKNSLSTGEIKTSAKNAVPTYGGSIVGWLREHTASSFQNNYMLDGSAASAYGEATDVTAEMADSLRLASGEICYKLNAGRADDAWFQTLSLDPYPVLFGTHLSVTLLDGEYVNDGADGIKSMAGGQRSTLDDQSPIYDLSGRKVSNAKNIRPSKGIYIVGGKKILVTSDN